MDNLRQSQHMIHRTNEEDTVIEWSSVSAKNEYEDLKSVSFDPTYHRSILNCMHRSLKYLSAI